ncbi:unnamed protein product [Amoebophrya sp. A120]|nr:unnamed protein product [Amoebophrya sp. A120]|eukprot:GSA120T00012161001.1
MDKDRWDEMVSGWRSDAHLLMLFPHKMTELVVSQLPADAVPLGSRNGSEKRQETTAASASADKKRRGRTASRSAQAAAVAEHPEHVNSMNPDELVPAQRKTDFRCTREVEAQQASCKSVAAETPFGSGLSFINVVVDQPEENGSSRTSSRRYSMLATLPAEGEPKGERRVALCVKTTHIDATTSRNGKDSSTRGTLMSTEHEKGKIFCGQPLRASFTGCSVHVCALFQPAQDRRKLVLDDSGGDSRRNKEVLLLCGRDIAELLRHVNATLSLAKDEDVDAWLTKSAEDDTALDFAFSTPEFSRTIARANFFESAFPTADKAANKDKSERSLLAEGFYSAIAKDPERYAGMHSSIGAETGDDCSGDVRALQSFDNVLFMASDAYPGKDEIRRNAMQVLAKIRAPIAIAPQPVLNAYFENEILSKTENIFSVGNLLKTVVRPLERALTGDEATKLLDFILEDVNVNKGGRTAQQDVFRDLDGCKLCVLGPQPQEDDQIHHEEQDTRTIVPFAKDDPPVACTKNEQQRLMRALGQERNVVFPTIDNKGAAASRSLRNTKMLQKAGLLQELQGQHVKEMLTAYIGKQKQPDIPEELLDAVFAWAKASSPADRSCLDEIPLLPCYIGDGDAEWAPFSDRFVCVGEKEWIGMQEYLSVFGVQVLAENDFSQGGDSTTGRDEATAFVSRAAAVHELADRGEHMPDLVAALEYLACRKKCTFSESPSGGNDKDKQSENVNDDADRRFDSEAAQLLNFLAKHSGSGPEVVRAISKFIGLLPIFPYWSSAEGARTSLLSKKVKCIFAMPQGDVFWKFARTEVAEVREIVVLDDHEEDTTATNKAAKKNPDKAKALAQGAKQSSILRLLEAVREVATAEAGGAPSSSVAKKRTKMGKQLPAAAVASSTKNNDCDLPPILRLAKDLFLDLRLLPVQNSVLMSKAIECQVFRPEDQQELLQEEFVPGNDGSLLKITDCFFVDSDFGRLSAGIKRGLNPTWRGNKPLRSKIQAIGPGFRSELHADEMLEVLLQTVDRAGGEGAHVDPNNASSAADRPDPEFACPSLTLDLAKKLYQKITYNDDVAQKLRGKRWIWVDGTVNGFVSPSRITYTPKQNADLAPILIPLPKAYEKLSLFSQLIQDRTNEYASSLVTLLEQIREADIALSAGRVVVENSDVDGEQAPARGQVDARNPFAAESQASAREEPHEADSDGATLTVKCGAYGLPDLQLREEAVVDKKCRIRVIENAVLALDKAKREKKFQPLELLLKRVLLPTKSLELKPAAEVFVNDLKWDPLGQNKTEKLRQDILHDRIGDEVGLALGAGKVRKRLKDRYHLNFPVQIMGLQESLTNRLKKIVNEYPHKFCFRELLQNAEDAGAKRFVAVYDHRTWKNHEAASLLSPEMARQQSKALAFCCDSIFKPGDFESLCALGTSRKDHATMIGAHGVGGKVLFGLTDVPGYWSGGQFLFLDPYVDSLADMGATREQPGVRLKNSETGGDGPMDAFPDQFEPFRKLAADIGIPLSVKGDELCGSIIRAPLRDKQQVERRKNREDSKNRISDHVTSSPAVQKELQKYLQANMSDLLLMLQSCTVFEYHEIDSDGTRIDAESRICKRNVKSSGGADLDHEFSQVAGSLQHVQYGHIELVTMCQSKKNHPPEPRTFLQYKQAKLVEIAKEDKNVGRFFCGLPIEDCKTGIPLHCSAFFRMSEDRRSILFGDNDPADAKGNNRELADQLVVALRKFCAIKGKEKKTTAFKYFPIGKESSPLSKYIENAFYQSLRESPAERVLYTISSKPVTNLQECFFFDRRHEWSAFLDDVSSWDDMGLELLALDKQEEIANRLQKSTGNDDPQGPITLTGTNLLLKLKSMGDQLSIGAGSVDPILCYCVGDKTELQTYLPGCKLRAQQDGDITKFARAPQEHLRPLVADSEPAWKLLDFFPRPDVLKQLSSPVVAALQSAEFVKVVRLSDVARLFNEHGQLQDPNVTMRRAVAFWDYAEKSFSRIENARRQNPTDQEGRKDPLEAANGLQLLIAKGKSYHPCSLRGRMIVFSDDFLAHAGPSGANLVSALQKCNVLVGTNTVKTMLPFVCNATEGKPQGARVSKKWIDLSEHQRKHLVGREVASSLQAALQGQNNVDNLSALEKNALRQYLFAIGNHGVSLGDDPPDLTKKCLELCRKLPLFNLLGHAANDRKALPEKCKLLPQPKPATEAAAEESASASEDEENQENEVEEAEERRQEAEGKVVWDLIEVFAEGEVRVAAACAEAAPNSEALRFLQDVVKIPTMTDEDFVCTMVNELQRLQSARAQGKVLKALLTTTDARRGKRRFAVQFTNKSSGRVKSVAFLQAADAQRAGCAYLQPSDCLSFKFAAKFTAVGLCKQLHPDVVAELLVNQQQDRGPDVLAQIMRQILTPEEVLEVADHIEANASSGLAIELFKHINLTMFGFAASGRKEMHEGLRSKQWLPVMSQRPQNWPAGLPWAGERLGGCLVRPDDYPQSIFLPVTKAAVGYAFPVVDDAALTDSTRTNLIRNKNHADALGIWNQGDRCTSSHILESIKRLHELSSDTRREKAGEIDGVILNLYQEMHSALTPDEQSQPFVWDRKTHSFLGIAAFHKEKPKAKSDAAPFDMKLEPYVCALPAAWKNLPVFQNVAKSPGVDHIVGIFSRLAAEGTGAPLGEYANHVALCARAWWVSYKLCPPGPNEIAKLIPRDKAVFPVRNSRNGLLEFATADSCFIDNMPWLSVDHGDLLDPKLPVSLGDNETKHILQIAAGQYSVPPASALYAAKHQVPLPEGSWIDDFVPYSATEQEDKTRAEDADSAFHNYLLRVTDFWSKRTSGASPERSPTPLEISFRVCPNSTSSGAPAHDAGSAPSVIPQLIVDSTGNSMATHHIVTELRGAAPLSDEEWKFLANHEVLFWDAAVAVILSKGVIGFFDPSKKIRQLRTGRSDVSPVLRFPVHEFARLWPEQASILGLYETAASPGLRIWHFGGEVTVETWKSFITNGAGRGLPFRVSLLAFEHLRVLEFVSEMTRNAAAGSSASATQANAANLCNRLEKQKTKKELLQQQRPQNQHHQSSSSSAAAPVLDSVAVAELTVNSVWVTHNNASGDSNRTAEQSRWYRVSADDCAFVVPVDGQMNHPGFGNILAHHASVLGVAGHAVCVQLKCFDELAESAESLGACLGGVVACLANSNLNGFDFSSPELNFTDSISPDELDKTLHTVDSVKGFYNVLQSALLLHGRPMSSYKILQRTWGRGDANATNWLEKSAHCVGLPAWLQKYVFMERHDTTRMPAVCFASCRYIVQKVCESERQLSAAVHTSLLSWMMNCVEFWQEDTLKELPLLREDDSLSSTYPRWYCKSDKIRKILSPTVSRSAIVKALPKTPAGVTNKTEYDAFDLLGPYQPPAVAGNADSIIHAEFWKFYASRSSSQRASSVLLQQSLRSSMHLLEEKLTVEVTAPNNGNQRIPLQPHCALRSGANNELLNFGNELFKRIGCRFSEESFPDIGTREDDSGQKTTTEYAGETVDFVAQHLAALAKDGGLNIIGAADAQSLFKFFLVDKKLQTDAGRRALADIPLIVIETPGAGGSLLEIAKCKFIQSENVAKLCRVRTQPLPVFWIQDPRFAPFAQQRIIKPTTPLEILRAYATTIASSVWSVDERETLLAAVAADQPDSAARDIAKLPLFPGGVPLTSLFATSGTSGRGSSNKDIVKMVLDANPGVREKLWHCPDVGPTQLRRQAKGLDSANNVVEFFQQYAPFVKNIPQNSHRKYRQALLELLHEHVAEDQASVDEIRALQIVPLQNGNWQCPKDVYLKCVHELLINHTDDGKCRMLTESVDDIPGAKKFFREAPPVTLVLVQLDLFSRQWSVGTGISQVVSRQDDLKQFQAIYEHLADALAKIEAEDEPELKKHEQSPVVRKLQQHTACVVGADHVLRKPHQYSLKLLENRPPLYMMQATLKEPRFHTLWRVLGVQQQATGRLTAKPVMLLEQLKSKQVVAKKADLVLVASKSRMRGSRGSGSLVRPDLSASSPSFSNEQNVADQDTVRIPFYQLAWTTVFPDSVANVGAARRASGPGSASIPSQAFDAASSSGSSSSSSAAGNQHQASSLLQQQAQQPISVTELDLRPASQEAVKILCDYALQERLPNEVGEDLGFELYQLGKRLNAPYIEEHFEAVLNGVVGLGIDGGLKELECYPSYWKNQATHLDFSERVQLDNTWVQKMTRLMNESSRAGSCNACGGKKFQVASVHRIENQDLWNRYAARRKLLFGLVQKKKRAVKRLEGTVVKGELRNITAEHGLRHEELNEFYCFHGTKPDFVEAIAEKEGFDERVANLGGLYGAGVYGADQACKSHQYTAADAQGYRSMFLCRFALGNPHYTSCCLVNARRPPRADKEDCVIAATGPMAGHFQNRQQHNELIVYDRSSVYAEFLIKYKEVLG